MICFQQSLWTLDVIPATLQSFFMKTIINKLKELCLILQMELLQLRTESGHSFEPKIAAELMGIKEQRADLEQQENWNLKEKNTQNLIWNVRVPVDMKGQCSDRL